MLLSLLFAVFIVVAVFAAQTLSSVNTSLPSGGSSSRVAYASPLITIPYKVNFQARLTDQNGNILPNGSYNIKFSLWTAATGGTNVWEEDYLDSNSQGVTITNGLFSVQLGSITALSPTLFSSNPNLYLQIELPSPATATSTSPSWTEGPMSPRQPLASSPYAFNADTLDGIDSTQFARTDQGNTFTGANSFNGNVSITGTNTLTVGGALTLGSTTTAASLLFNDGSGHTVTLQSAGQANNIALSIPADTNTTDTICLQTKSNCSATGAAGGDLTGSYPNPTIAKLQGSTLTISSPVAGQVLNYNGTAWINTSSPTLAGNLTVQGTGNSSFAGNLGIGTTSPGANLDVESAATTGTAVNITANSLTTGSGLSVNQAGTVNTSSITAANLLNVNRLVNSNVTNGAVTLDSTSGFNSANSNNPWTASWSHTVGNYTNRYLIVPISDYETTISNVTYNGVPMTLLGQQNSSNNDSILFYGLANPAVGTHTISFLVTPNSSFGGDVSVVASSWYNVNQASPVGTFAGVATSTNPTTLNVSTSNGQVVVDAADNYSSGSASLGSGQTNLGYQPGFETSSQSSYKSASGTSTTMTINTLAYVYAAIPLNSAGSAGADIQGNLANLSSNCTVTAGGCTDSSNILNLNQQYTGATGTVAVLQNAGTGDMLDFLNGSGTFLSGFNSNGQLYYKYGSYTAILATAALTANQTITLPNASGTVCLSSSNCSNYLTSTTGVQLQGTTPGTAQTGNFNISGTGIAGALQGGSSQQFQVDNSGNISTTGTALIKNASSTAFQVQNTSGSSLLTVDANNGVVIVKAPNSNPGTSAGVARLVVQSNWTDTAGDNSIIDFGENASNQTNAGRLMYNGLTNLTSFGALNSSGTYNQVLSFNSGNGVTLHNYAGSLGLTLQNDSTSAGIVIKPGTGADRSNAVQIQNASGTSILNVNSSTSTVQVQAANDAATVGSEMFTSSESFPTTTGWTAISGTGSSATATHTAGGGTTALSPTPALTIVSGNTYQITFTVSGGNGNGTDNLLPNIGGASGVKVYDASTTQTQVITATGTGNLTFTPTTNWTGTITSVSVKQITTTNAVLQVLNSSGTATIDFRSGGTGSADNTFIGLGSGKSNTTGQYSTGYGYAALQGNTTGTYNTANGYGTLASNTTGTGNTAQGAYSLLYNVSGNYNVANGMYSLYANTTGSNNTASGYASLFSNLTGSNNVSVGTGSMYLNTTGSNNTALGDGALYYNTTGSTNLGLGYGALNSNTTGSNNIGIGSYAGDYDLNARFFTSSNLQNAAAIGAYAQVQKSNTIALGSVDNPTQIVIGSTVPIGTNSFGVSPVDLNSATVTASQTSGSGTITASAAIFSASNVGEELVWADGTTETITGYTSTTVVTGSSTTITETNSYFRTQHIGLQVTNTGNTYIQNTSTTAFQVQNATGASTLFSADTVNSQVSIGQSVHYNDQTLFANPEQISAGISYPQFISTTDVNGDGKPDLVYTNGGALSNYITVALGNGNGTFATPVNYTATSTSNSVYYIATADVNGDGKPDIIASISGLSGSNNVVVLMNNGNGTFAAPVNYSVAGQTYAIAVADVNGDGKPDIVVGSDNGTPSVSVLMNNGNGTFAAPVSYPIGGDARALALADVNGDGKPDIIVSYTGYIAVLMNNGNGTFAAPVTYASTSAGYSIAVADVNGDGKPDIIGANYSATGQVQVFLNNGNGTFAAPVSYSTATEDPTAVAVTDINGDGKPDIITANDYYSPAAMSVLLGNGNGTFGAATSYPASLAEGFLSVAVADFNGDGKPDVVVPDYQSSGGSLYLYTNNLDYGSHYSGLSVQTNSANQAGIVIQGSSGQVANLLRIQGASGAGIFNVLSNGNVGIGTDAPGYKLDVQGGDMNVSGYYRQNGEVVINNNAPLDNIFMGLSSGNPAATGSDNLAIGNNQTLSSSTSGNSNVAIGSYSLNANTTGSGNTAVGVSSLNNNTTGTENVSLGESLFRNTTGSYNTALGEIALANNTTGSGNSALGYQAGNEDVNYKFSTPGNLQNSTAIGTYAQVQANNTIVLGSVDIPTQVVIGATVPVGTNSFGVSPVDLNSTTVTASQTSGSGAIASSGSIFTASNVGEELIWADGATETITGYTDSAHVTGSSTTITETNKYFRTQHIGFQVTNTGNAYVQNTSTTAFNVQNANGTSVLQVDTTNGQIIINGGNAQLRAPDTHDLFLGNTSGDGNTGKYNLAIGNYSLSDAGNSGNGNVSVGESTLQVNTTGAYNTALGYTALNSNTTGSYNVGIGESAISNNTTGSNNTSLGENTLLTNTTGSGNTALGYQANVGSNNLQNATAIGTNAYVTASNSLVLGCISGTNGCANTTNVGIGNTAPAALFSVGSTSQFQVDINGNAKTSGTVTANTLQASTINLTNGTYTISISSATQANNLTLTIPADTNTTDTVCLQKLANCGGGSHIKNITLPAEYAGAALDAASDASCSSANSGVMATGYNSTTNQNFYEWASNSPSTNCYDVVVQIPVPAGFTSWSGTPTLYVADTNSSASAVCVQALDNGTADSAYSSYQCATTTSSLASYSLPALTSSYTAGGTLTLKIRLTSTSNTDVAKAGTLSLSYNSSF